MPQFAAIADWLSSPLGRRVHALECKHAGAALAQVFGWQLLQIGHWGDDGALLSEARTQHKTILARAWPEPLAGISRVQSRTDALAIAADSVDAVFLPHTLEHEPDPYALLREVERILMGDGCLVVLGFRAASFWGMRHLFARNGFPPGTERLLGERRVRDWLKLLGFEVIDAQRYLFTAPWGKAAPSAQRFAETIGGNLWPFLAGAYLLKARKRVYTMTPVRWRWRKPAQVVGGLIEPARRGSTPASFAPPGNRRP